MPHAKRKQVEVVHRNGRRSKRLAPVPIERSTRKDSRGLTPRQEHLASELATQMLVKPKGAISRAAETVYKSSSAAAQALKKAEVRNAVDEHVRRMLEVADITRDRIILELGRIAFFDARKMFNDDGGMKPIEEMDDDTAAAIQGFDVERRTEGKGENAEVYYILKPRAYNKNQALEILTRLEKLPADKPGDSGAMAPMPVINIHFVDPRTQQRVPGVATVLNGDSKKLTSGL
jgi:phage terminase small subunit